MSRRARAEASVWIVKLHGPDRSTELEAAFRSWLAAHPENAHQFERVTAVWDAGAVPVPGVPRMAHLRPEYRVEERSQPRRWLLAAAVASVVAAIGAGTWSANRFWLNSVYTTGFAEQRIVMLTDGSRLTLNSDSAVTVAFRRGERRVELDHGEAYFEVAADASRPFLVRSGDHEVKVLGTTFDVRQEAEQLMVTLVKGKVAVSNVEDSAPTATLAPGQRLRVSDAHSTPVIDNPSMDRVTAWRRGEVMLDDTPLSEAIAEMNRYDQRLLIIDDPSIASVRVSGIYHLGDSDLFAAMVAKLYGFSVQHRGGRIYLVKRSETFTAEN